MNGTTIASEMTTKTTINSTGEVHKIEDFYGYKRLISVLLMPCLCLVYIFMYSFFNEVLKQTKKSVLLRTSPFSS